MRYALLLGMQLLFLSVPVSAVQFNGETLEAVRRGCLMEAYQKLAEVDGEKESIELDEWIVSELERPLSYEQKLYFSGVLFLRQGLDHEARNAFYRYLVWASRQTPLSKPEQYNEVAEFFEGERDQNDDSDIGVASVPDRPMPVKKMVKVRRSRPASSKKDPSDMLRRAKRAAQKGQVEYSLRLARLAEKLDPNSLEARKMREELEAEVR